MRRQGDPLFERTRASAWQQAWTMSALAANSAPPVALHELASKLRIRQIEFLPLISTAGIRPLDGGYVIYINTRAPGAESVTRERLEPTHDDFSNLNSPLRFTVAHEMAHVFFFNAVGGNHDSPLLRKHWQAIENSCNQMARVLLLPKAPFLRELGPDLLAAPQLWITSRRFAVSPRVLIYRLQLEDLRHTMADSDGGLIGLVEEGRDQAMLVAVHTIGTFARMRWPKQKWSPEGISVNDLHLLVAWEKILNRSERVTVDAEVDWRGDEAAPCRLDLLPISRRPFSAILTIRVTGYVRPRADTLQRAM